MREDWARHARHARRIMSAALPGDEADRRAGRSDPEHAPAVLRRLEEMELRASATR